MISLVSLVLAAAANQDADVEKVLEFEKKVRACVEKAKPAYVFFGQGSGVCISPDGWVLTNFHVAGDRDGQKVRLTGGRRFVADVVGFDPHGDISLCKLQGAKDLPFCELGDSDALEVGQTVIAVGNPFMLGNTSWEPTITLGIVSALHRYMDNPGYFDAIQTDAQINPGNSGGPLITLDGKVVGINGRIDIKRFMNRVNTGIGYAIPSRQIERYMKAFKEGGRALEGCILGITVGECGDERYENVGRYGDGVFVAGVTDGTPGARAGFQPGDIITEIEGYRIGNLNRFHGVAGNWPQGETVGVRVRRAGGTVALRAYLGDPAQVLAREVTLLPADPGFRPAPDERAPGVRLAEVLKNGPAEKAGLKAGDVLRAAEGKLLRNWEDLKAVLKEKKPGEAVKLRVAREGKESELELTLPAPPPPKTRE
jgi:serine protease Do